MTRQEFIEKSILMGMGLPFLSSTMFNSCQKDEILFPDLKTNFSGKIIIIGAGAAGLSAGYMLKRYGVDFNIIEAAPQLGGRLKKNTSFTDFPIDVGAEWIHTDPKVLAEIINNPSIDANIDILVYNPQTIMSWNNGKLRSHNYIRNFYSEWKFKRSTWFDFFEQFIVPEIADKIILNNPITEVNYEFEKVILSSLNSDVYEADKVLITSSIKTLQSEQILFKPELPLETKNAIGNIFMGDGIKIFIEFKEKFYPDILAFGNILSALEEEEKFVYDAAFRKETSKNILGLFAINEKAKAYTQLPSDDDIIEFFLTELDEIFDGKASANYVHHVIQNWSNEEYIQGAYSYSFKGNQSDIVNTINESVSNKLYFAGEALSLNNQAMVHGACESAYSTVTAMLKDK